MQLGGHDGLVRLLGFPGALLHGDTLVLDRWLWLKKRLPQTLNGERLLDLGCGSGAFTIGSALRGYDCVGLSWDERNSSVARRRAAMCGATKCAFYLADIRRLDETHPHLMASFDVVICLEVIEHVIDDRALMHTIAACLKPGGRVLMSTPYALNKAITADDNGPFERIEDGRHVRRGYNRTMLAELCEDTGLCIEEFSFCSGFFSQKITAGLRVLSRHSHALAWGLSLPLRILPPTIDTIVSRITGWPNFSICVEAVKPRYNTRTK